MPTPDELSGTLWPIHLKPFDDELLSSWMVRLARAYGVPPVRFWHRVWPLSRKLSWRFLDYLAPTELLVLLSERTATPYERVRQTTLAAFGELPFVPQGQLELRYCPPCLAEDQEPYFRRHWQIGAFLLCERHPNWLLTDCGHCHRPLEPERVSLEREAMVSCAACGHDRRTSERRALGEFGPVQCWQQRLWPLLALRASAGIPPFTREGQPKSDASPHDPLDDSWLSHQRP